MPARPRRQRRRLAVLLALAVALLLAAGVPRLFEPSTRLLVYAMGELGPISGWRCAENSVYVYDPRRDSSDGTLLADAPERLIWNEVPDVEVDRVEANLRGGDTVVWTHILTAEAASGENRRRVYVLSPGRLQTIGVDLGSGWTAICTSHLGDWHIVAEHALE